MSSQVIDIIIPVYNEEEALPAFYSQLAILPIPFHLIFIDNGSTDKSLDFIASINGATVIRHENNMGYGASLRTGIRCSTTEKIIIIDADGEYSPDVIPAIVEELDHTDIVHTSRFLEKSNVGMSILRYYGNTIVTCVFNKLFAEKLTDLYTGCKGYRRNKVAHLDMDRDGFEHVLEISARLVSQSSRIKEIPVRYTERKTGRSKMRHLFEVVKYCFFVVYYYVTLKNKDS